MAHSESGSAVDNNTARLPSQEKAGMNSEDVYIARHIGPFLTGGLQRFLDHPLLYRPLGAPPRGTRAIVGWGLKGKFKDAAAFAARHGLPYLALEDGFLRSVSLGDTDPPLSVALDDVGVYYDASRPSRLEQLIAAPHGQAQRTRASLIAAAWRTGRLSKYNHARELGIPVDGPFALVVDQTAGDASIERGSATPASFRRMLEAALDENPGMPVVLKVHPDVIAGRKRAHFDALGAGATSRVTLLATNAHPPALLEAAQSVYVVTSQMGFEAMLWGRPVRTFGMPFYAGWGLTRDELAAPRRRSDVPSVTLDDLVHAALVEYPRYVDPETGERCEVERLMEWMALQRRMRERFAAQIQMVAFSQWKQPIARAFLSGSNLHFVEGPQPMLPGSARAVWGRPADDAKTLHMHDGPLLRVEDGFLRSVGLGANWVPPLSWVIDRRGMYYDAGSPSDLESLLQGASFDDALRQRARTLRQTIVAAGITKYNVGTGQWKRPPGTRTVVLVPGQVESDLSIAYGAPGMRSNLDLLRHVREDRRDAYLVYKPHPDVLARKRTAGADVDEAHGWCDEVVTDVPIGSLLDAVDEVHVLTSLAGFEALLRGKRVVCHGSPFYAGWGLTEDTQSHPRRTRRLTIDELVAAALILYPTYVSRVSGAFTTPERALYELQHWQQITPPREAGWLRVMRAVKRMRDRWRRA
jgi:capsular polysaccharide export protein